MIFKQLFFLQRIVYIFSQNYNSTAFAKFKQQLAMQLGDTDFPLQVTILFIFLILSLIFNIFLFLRGHQSYSIKYELMLARKSFRTKQYLTNIVQVIYKCFFALPFIILLVIAILRAIVKPIQFLTILVNGLIVLLIIYPFKISFFYAKQIIIWIFAIASQFIQLFIYSNKSSTDFYTILSVIFYPVNCILFCLAILSQENNYWELQEAVKLCENELKQICPAFVQKQSFTEQIYKRGVNHNKSMKSTIKTQQQITVYKNIPFNFKGGLYGALCKNYHPIKYFILYILSLCILGLNAYLIYLTSGSALGVIGLVTNFIYDLFIFSFNSLNTPERSIRNVYILIFFGRFLSFVFGQNYWIFGYCVLYFFVGIFIGRIIINKRLPLKLKKENKEKHEYTNAFKTPQFVIFILSVEIFVLVLLASLKIGTSNVSVSYNSQISIPLWQFALLIVIATWIIILYMASMRMYERNEQNINESIQYYFGTKSIKQFHVYILITYLMIIGLGIYCKYILLNSTTFFACIFLPLIYLVLQKMFQQWVRNQYQVLADIKQYNQRAEKLIKIIQKKQNALSKQKNKHQNSQNILMETNQLMLKPQKQQGQNENENSFFPVLNNSNNSETQSHDSVLIKQIDNLNIQKQGLQTLIDWRQTDSNLSGIQLWNNLTPSDRWLISLFIVLTLLFIGLIITSYMASDSLFGVFVVIVLISLLSLTPFYRYIKSFRHFGTSQFIFFQIGLAIGIIYWSIYNKQLIFTMLWSAIYLSCLLILVILGVAKKIQKLYIYWLLLNIGLTLIFVCIFLGFTVQPIATGIVSFIIALIITGSIPIAYSYIEGSIPTFIKIICGSIIVCGIVIFSILGFLLDIVSNFAVFSFVMGSIYIILTIVGCIIFYSKQAGKYQNPHVYSAFGQPIYRFDSSSEQLKSSKNHKVLLDIASVILIIYAATISLMFESKQYAIYVLGYYCCITFFENILFSLKTYSQLGMFKQRLTKQLVLKSLNQLVGKYMVDFNYKDIKFSQELDKKKDDKKQQAQNINDEDNLNQIWLQIAKIDKQYIKNKEEEEKFLYFWILLIELHVFAQQKGEMTQLIKEVKQIQSKLIQYGIFIESVNFALDFTAKYELLVKEIQNLHPFDFVNFQQILTNHKKQMKIRNQEQNRLSSQIQKMNQQKEKQMYAKIKDELNKNQNDKISQFKNMTGKLKKGQRYNDTNFSPQSQQLNILGPALESVVDKWRNPTTTQYLVKDGFSPYDVKQGKIGDCYLISSLGVLGQKWIKSALGFSQDNKINKWENKKGAYMVRFFKFMKEVYITIDDRLPVNKQGEFVFARSQDQKEIWPCLLQKAYAKLYSGYGNIVQGKCHRVFAQFTGGFPTEILVQTYSTNPNGLWQKIINAKANNYLLAAGSPSNPNGDTASSKRGIVQGHAYSILDAQQVEGHKLIKLKNPHGSGGIEWNGDFSDNSEYMTNRIMQLLNHSKANDGVFWMNLEDFIHQFKSLYICAVFDDSWKSFKYEGEFTEQNSFGSLLSSNKAAKNPQFGITITKKCTLFVTMTQQSQNPLYGGNYITMRIQSNNGQRICKQNAIADRVCGSIIKYTNSVSISNEAVLNADSYPYTFTLYVGCKDNGDKGMFTLEMNCNDKDFEVIDDKDFDRAGFQQ